MVNTFKKPFSAVGTMCLNNMYWRVLEQDAEENIYTSEGGTKRKLEKTAHRGTS
jgi:hypothetical protein